MRIIARPVGDLYRPPTVQLTTTASGLFRRRPLATESIIAVLAALVDVDDAVSFVSCRCCNRLV
jgi:hypothetical protein